MDYRFNAIIEFTEKPSEKDVTELVDYFYDIDYSFDKNIVKTVHEPHGMNYADGHYKILFDFLRTYLDRAKITIQLFDKDLFNPTIFELKQTKND